MKTQIQRFTSSSSHPLSHHPVPSWPDPLILIIQGKTILPLYPESLIQLATQRVFKYSSNLTLKLNILAIMLLYTVLIQVGVLSILICLKMLTDPHAG